jgi:hypothetical protein
MAVRLKQEVPPKKISAFISSAVRAKLHPDTKTLDAAYRAARKERWRKELAAQVTRPLLHGRSFGHRQSQWSGWSSCAHGVLPSRSENTGGA